MRSKPVVHNAFEVATNHINGTMQIFLIRDGIKFGSAQIPTKEASVIAATVLGGARDSYDQSGKPPPKEEEIDLTVISPSGYNVGPGRKSGKTMLIFYFGDTTLGIEIPNSDAQLLLQRLVTAGAEGTAQ
jgi:hypothetical protein